MDMVTINDIRDAIKEIGLVDLPICLHSSLRSFGYVDGGPATITKGFLAEGCTLIVPTFSSSFFVPPPRHMRPARNGWNYARADEMSPGTDRIYSPESNELDQDMGAIPAEILQMPGRIRGNHPLNSFTAIGPSAQELIAGQGSLDVFAPFKELTAKKGWILLMGVDLNRMTFLHFAEQESGRKLFRRWANDHHGQPMMVATGGCSEGFSNFEPILEAFARRKHVGKSLWRAYPAQTTLIAAASAIREDPYITHCGDIQCERCRDAVLGGPILTGRLDYGR
jgi:aminoglycoside 3-N-acetyltransferase